MAGIVIGRPIALSPLMGNFAVFVRHVFSGLQFTVALLVVKVIFQQRGGAREGACVSIRLATFSTSIVQLLPLALKVAPCWQANAPPLGPRTSCSEISSGRPLLKPSPYWTQSSPGYAAPNSTFRPCAGCPALIGDDERITTHRFRRFSAPATIGRAQPELGGKSNVWLRLPYRCSRSCLAPVPR